MKGRSRWRFSFWPVTAFICLLPALVALGAWQVQRGQEKAAAFEDFENASAGAARDITGLPLGEINALPRFERVALRGHYLSGRHFLLDNMPRNGRPGHHVLTPFEVEGAAHVVIIDRGWRPGRAADSDANSLDAAGEHVAGMLAGFPQPALQLDAKPAYEGWPRIVQFPQAPDLAAMLERPVAVPRLLLDEQAAFGFVRDWEPPGIPPARHYAYAFQWFGLALALIVIFFVVARPKKTDKPEKQAE